MTRLIRHIRQDTNESLSGPASKSVTVSATASTTTVPVVPRTDQPAPSLKTAPGLRTLHSYLGKTGPLSQGVQAGRKALRIRHINGMEVRKKRPGEFK
jgi:hypothetical protein